MGRTSNFSVSDVPSESVSTRKWFKPFILRVPGLALMFLFAMCLIGALEYVARTLPGIEKTHRPAIVGKPFTILKRQTSTTGVKPPPAYVSTTLTSTQTTIVASHTPPAAYVSTTLSTPMPTSATAPAAYVSSVVTESIVAPTTTLFATPPPFYVSTKITTMTSPQSTGVAPTSIYVSTSIKTVTANTTGDGGLGDNPTAHQMPTIWPLWKSFVGGYLPLILAVIFKIFWLFAYANVKLIEPFIQLSTTDGALARDTLFNLFLSSDLTPVMITSLFKGRWLVFWTGLVSIVVMFLTPLVSECIFVDTNYGCPNPNPKQPDNPCWPPRLSYDPVILRMLQALLSYIAVMTLVIMAMLFRSATGILTDPSSIASIVALVHHPSVPEDFRRLGSEATDKEAKSQLSEKKYHLGSYQRPDGIWRYGIIPSGPWNQPQPYVQTVPVSSFRIRLRKGLHSTLTTILDIFFLFILLGVLGVVVGYFEDTSDSGFNRFFNSNGFGPRFFMAAVGIIVAVNWKRLERNVYTLSPYRRLAKGPSPPKPTILMHKKNLPFAAFFTLLLRNHIFAAVMALGTILSEVLIVTLARIPFSPGEIYFELLVSSYISMVILGIMILILVFLFFWRIRLPELPRWPDTLAGVISYICDSRMVDNFEGCEWLNGDELDARVKGMGRMYSYGRYRGVSGTDRWMVDEDTLASS